MLKAAFMKCQFFTERGAELYYKCTQPVVTTRQQTVYHETLAPGNSFVSIPITACWQTLTRSVQPNMLVS